MFTNLRQLFAYGVCGVLTTAINIATFELLSDVISLEAANVLAWFVSVAFAYVTNRRFVFESKTHGRAAVGREMAGFFASRAGTGLFDILFVSVSVRFFGWNKMVVKVVSNVIVIVANFVLGRLVFNNRPEVFDEDLV